MNALTVETQRRSIRDRWQSLKQRASGTYLKLGIGTAAALGSAASYATGGTGGTTTTLGAVTLPTPDLADVATYIASQFTPVMNIGLAVLGLMVVMALLRWARGVIA